MKKLLLVFLTSVFFILNNYSQEKSYKQPTTLGIHFIFNDFATAQLIRSTSLSAVLRDHRFGKLSEMSQGLALSYGKGLSEHFDFSSTLAGSFLSYPFQHRPASGSDYLLLEADASIRGKMLSDRYWFVPYLQVGAGVSKYQGYWGTFIPAGIGIQISFFGEAYLLINSQYRIAVTESTNYHFWHGIGLVGNIGRRS
jgi:OmpA-OmpF porin, OOP family